MKEGGKYESKEGVLTLTTKRLIFESRSGIFSRGTFVNVDVSLANITNVTVEGRIAKKLCIQLRHGNYPPRYEFDLPNPEEWQQSLLRALSAVTAESQSGGAGPSIIEREVVVKEIVKIPCRYCGTLVSVTDTRCTNCGAPLGPK